ncbi:d-3-phosphoglycerate dehydrogenase [Anaeramoeba ignava]|uniref:D-3-phosphoglycerate dehydrogenase n=1 Tax=Anaeramoeba ignava TaxID=1746090 RepID=A0A9Q0LMF5_ANAIG|nr:d-3-phosphoglycerate dehydrogenase [Anaeramoeba ignava]|eukprot:Anaeramoba_ignava/a348797_649.p1 GENE.a348797_649~~a348797_649.p1  ORF type:complete len:329 (-),score=84.94 a348797_649:43-1029(-)
MSLKVLIADKVDQQVLDGIKALGCEVTSNAGISADQLPNEIKGFDILIVRSTRVTADTINNSDLKMVIRAGAGVDTIDIDAATKKGVFVCNTPGANGSAVAELVVGMLICCDRKIAETTSRLKSGEWCKTSFQDSLGIRGRTLGIIGLGQIGRMVALTCQAMGMNIVSYDKYVSKEVMDSLNVGFCESVEEMLPKIDALTLHTVLTDETRHMLNKKTFAMMKDGCIIINASRGEVINQEDLVEAIKTKHLKVALDVFENEPPANGKDFSTHKELTSLLTCCTPHIGASTKQAAEMVGVHTVEIVEFFVKNSNTPPPRNVVNRELLEKK